MKTRQAITLVFYKAYADLKAESTRSYLGFLWWLIEPVLYLFAFYILIVMVLERGGPDFVPFFLCGAVVWKWFDSGIKGGVHSISAQRGLLQVVYVPKYIFPMTAVISSTMKFMPLIVSFLVFLVIYGAPFRPSWFALPFIFVTQLLLILSLSILVSAISPFLPDIKVAIDNGIMLLFFISGIFFDINEVNEPLRSYLLINPMANLIDEYRNVLMRGQGPDIERLVVTAFASLIVASLALLLLKRLDKKYSKLPF